MCNERVVVNWLENGKPNLRQCGTYYSGEMVLCEKHEAQAHERYPQGWDYYPGDVCKHGTYVGGCGADYMCGRCELE